MKEAIEQLEAFKGQLGAHIKALESWQQIVAENELHVLPVLQGGQVSVRVLNFNKAGKPGDTTMEGIPAAFFYEAYREQLGVIFTRAVEKAQGSVAERAAALREQLAAEKEQLAAAEKELANYLNPGAETETEADGDKPARKTKTKKRSR